VDKQQQQPQEQEQQPQEQEEDAAGFTVVSVDESFFFYDSLVRRVWIVQDKRPIVKVTGSHQRSCVFGAVSMEGKKKKKKKKQQLFRQYDDFNGDTFLEFLKKIHAKFQKCYLFMDKATPHYTCKKVIKYFEDNKDTLIPVYLPTASPEFMVMEKIWNIAKRDLLVLKYYSSFSDLKDRISAYFRTKRFNLDMRNYLLRDAI
jgi:transposase